jgi:multimeric flavodoxin WrbA
MKVLTILGSRNPEGKTATAAKAFLRPLQEAGAVCELAFLPQLKLSACRQCDAEGWGLCRSRGACVIEDGFAELVAKVAAADAVVFANPVYYGEFSESLANFLRRLRRITINPAGKEPLEGKLAVGICVAGNNKAVCASAAQMQDCLEKIGFSVFDVIPVWGRHLPMKQEMLEVGGRWLRDRGPADC